MILNQLIDSLLSSKSIDDLEAVVIKSIDVLKENVLVKAKFYEGDLLMTLLSVKEEFWKSNPDLWKKLVETINNQEDRIESQQVSFEMKGDWYEKIDSFKKIFF